MAYTTIIFNSTDEKDNDICSFKVNLISKELLIVYRNNSDNYITKGLELKDEEIPRIDDIASQIIFERFSEGKWRNNQEPQWIVDVIEWKSQFISDDGFPILEIKSELLPYLPPQELVELVQYILKIATPKNYRLNLFKKEK